MTAPLTRSALPSMQLRPDASPGAQRTGAPTIDATARSPRPSTVNPVRIGRIGTDNIQVFIRPPASDTEFAALIDRMDQLVAAGYETIDVVFEDAPQRGAGTRTATTEPVGG